MNFLLRRPDKVIIFAAMFPTLPLSELRLGVAGALLAPLPLRAKLLPLLRRAR